MRIKFGIFVCVAGFLALAQGCATFSEKRAPLVDAAARGDYDLALKKLDRLQSDPPNLIDLMDRGAILNQKGNPQDSNGVFETTERKIEELDVKSVSREAATYLINDNTQAYSGERYERTWVNILKAFNYIVQSDLQSAFVEIRKIDFQLQLMEGDLKNKSIFRNHAFANYLSGMLHEAAGELNDAHISYRKAIEGYAEYERNFGIPTPEALKMDVLRTSRLLGISEQYAEYKRRFPEAAARLEASGKFSTSEAIVLVEVGKIAHKEERAWSLQGENGLMLRVPYPVYVDTPFPPQVVSVQVAGVNYPSVLVENLSSIAEKTLAERIDFIKGKATGRMLAKAAASAAAGVAVAQSTNDPALGALAATGTNMLLGLSERADTRSWLTLPAEVQMVRIPFDGASGTEDLLIRFGAGQKKVTVTKAKRAFVILRATE